MGAKATTTALLKEYMADALLRLMETKNYAKITIDEIAAGAGVNRSTWFRNFSNKNEALTYKLVRLWERYSKEHGLPERRRFHPEQAVHFFRYNCQIQRLLQAIYAANLQSVVFDAFYQIMMPSKDADPYDNYEARFYSYALLGLLDEWIKRGFREKPEEMAGLFRKILSGPSPA